MADRLTEGQKLVRGESLVSNNGAYTLTLQDDGNLVLASRGKPIWATGTNGQDVVRAEVQHDGNFVLYTADKPVWHSDTKGKKDVALILQDDRNLVLYSKSGPVWSTKTETDGPPPPEPVAEQAEEPLADKSATDPALGGWAAKKREAAEAAGEPAAEPAAQQAAPAEEPPAPAAQTYTVVSGDTLWAISERFYGDGSKYQVIADASGIPNPDLIYPGQVLTIP